MKLKFFVIILVSVLFFCAFSSMLIKTSNAESNNDGVSIINMSYDVLKTEESSPYTFVYYKLIISLHNSGSQTSDDMTVVIIDDDAMDGFPGIKTRAPHPVNDLPINIPPGESKDFVFGEKTEWMIVGTGTHVLTVHVYPNNNESAAPLRTKTLTISSDGDTGGVPATSNTPGFELIFAICAIFTILLINKKRKK